MIKAVIFDCDGLILDTETAWYEAFSELFREHGTHDPLYSPYTYLAECTSQAVDRIALHKRAEEKHARLMQDVGLRPGVEDYLQTAPGAANAAGLHCVIVPNALTEDFTFDAYDLRLSSMSDLPL